MHRASHGTAAGWMQVNQCVGAPQRRAMCRAGRKRAACNTEYRKLGWEAQRTAAAGAVARRTAARNSSPFGLGPADVVVA